MASGSICSHCSAHAQGDARLPCRGLQIGADGTAALGDVIVSVAGQPVTGVDDVLAALEQYSIGETVPLGIKRGADVILLEVPLFMNAEDLRKLPG